jgi:hypothetical protein
VIIEGGAIVEIDGQEHTVTTFETGLVADEAVPVVVARTRRHRLVGTTT